MFCTSSIPHGINALKDRRRVSSVFIPLLKIYHKSDKILFIPTAGRTFLFTFDQSEGKGIKDMRHHYIVRGRKVLWRFTRQHFEVEIERGEGNHPFSESRIVVVRFWFLF